MPLLGTDPKQRHWEHVSLPVIPTIVAGSYNSPILVVDEYGRITSITPGGGASVVVQNNGITLGSGPFGVMNFTGSLVATPGVGGSVTISENSAIAAQSNGVSVPGGPFETLNFIGTSVTATLGAPGVLSVTITANPPNNVEFRKAAIGTGANQNIGAPIPAGSTLHTVSVTINTPYSVGAVLEVRDGAGNVLMPAANIDPQLAGTYTHTTPGNTTSLTNPQILLIVTGAPVVGSGVVDVHYEKP